MTRTDMSQTPPPPLAGLGREADQGWGEGVVRWVPGTDRMAPPPPRRAIAFAAGSFRGPVVGPRGSLCRKHATRRAENHGAARSGFPGEAGCSDRPGGSSMLGPARIGTAGPAACRPRSWRVRWAGRCGQGGPVATACSRPGGADCGNGLTGVLADEEAQDGADAVAGLLRPVERAGPVPVPLGLEFDLAAADFLVVFGKIAAIPGDRLVERDAETALAQAGRDAEVAADIGDRAADRAAADFCFELLQGGKFGQFGPDRPGFRRCLLGRLLRGRRRRAGSARQRGWKTTRSRPRAARASSTRSSAMARRMPRERRARMDGTRAVPKYCAMTEKLRAAARCSRVAVRWRP